MPHVNVHTLRTCIFTVFRVFGSVFKDEGQETYVKPTPTDDEVL